jgi:hypothetical protein
MKPTRKVSPRSFVTQVAGSGGPTGEAQAGQGRSAPGTDHDLVQPAGKSGGGGAANDSDGGH